jgi:uncharacterized membrane protein
MDYFFTMNVFKPEQNLIENDALFLKENDNKLSENLIYLSKPNNSLSPLIAIYIFSIVALFVLIVALGFAKVGAWPVLIYAFAVLIGLSLAFQHAFNHAGDFEKLAIQDGVFHLEIKELEKYRSYEINAFWAELVTKYLADGDCQQITLRSHGREIKIGRHLSAEKRNAVATQLKSKLLEFK